MGIGGTIHVDGVSFTMTPALHSSSVDENGTVIPRGLQQDLLSGWTVSGFTMRGYCLVFRYEADRGSLQPDVALLPIGGRYTMGVDEAMIAANFIGARIIIPIHYNTFDRITADPDLFKRSIERTTDLKVSVLQPGGSIEIRS